MLPDLPSTSRALYFTAAEKAFAQNRMQLEGRKGKEPFTRLKIKKIFSSWHIHVLTLLYIAFNNGTNGSQPTFAQWLKASTDPVYEIWQINVYPTTTYAVQIVTTLLYAWTSDSVFRGARWPAFLFGGSINVLCYISLAIWDIPVGWKWACFVMAGSGFGLSGLVFAWAHEICSDDNEERALVTASMNEMAYVFQAWLPLLVWKQTEAPEYRKGYITATCLSLLMMSTAMVTKALHRRQNRKRALHAAEQRDSASAEEHVSGLSVQPKM